MDETQNFPLREASVVLDDASKSPVLVSICTMASCKRPIISGIYVFLTV